MYFTKKELFEYKLNLLKKLNHNKDMFKKYKINLYANQIEKLTKELKKMEG